MMQDANTKVKTHVPALTRRLSVLEAAILCVSIGLVCGAGPVEAQSNGDCGFFFCEHEEWLSNQNAIHFTSGYALHLTATGLNKSPWKNFLWISIAGLGIETFQGAFLEHPLHGGFSYKNVIFNELGMLAGLAASRILFERDGETDLTERPSSPPGRLSYTGAVLPMEQHLRSCCCGRPAGNSPFSRTSLVSTGAAVAGLLKPGVFARYNGSAGAPPQDRVE